MVKRLKTKVRRKAAVLAGLVVTLALLATVVFAANILGFEVEGDLYSGTDSPVGLDWAQGTVPPALANTGVLIPATSDSTGKVAPVDNTAVAGIGTSARDLVSAEPNGDDDIFTMGSKETDFTDANRDKVVDAATDVPNWHIEPGNVPPNKDDFSFIYAYTNLAANDEVYIAFERLNNNGDSHVSIEFDPAGTAPCPNDANSDCPVRSDDGSSFGPSVLVSYDMENGGRNVISRVFWWDTDPTWAVTPAQKKEYPWKEVGAAEAGIDAQVLNQGGSIPAGPWGSVDSSGTLRTTIPVRGFFETAADLSDLGINPGCPGITQIWVKSRASDEISSELKDVQTVHVDLTNCGSKSGQKFEDVNGNGTKDAGDNGLSGWDIKLYKDANGNGVLEDADDGTTDSTITAFKTATTDASGNYTFADLTPAKYIVCEVLKTGWQQTAPTSGANCSVVSGQGAKGFAITIDPFEQETGNNFGNFKLITKSGVKLEDMDGDGNIAEDTGNPLQNWNIRLYKDVNGDGALDAGDTLQSTVATNASGEYSFPSLGPGKYLVCEELKTGWVQTAPTSGANCTAVAGLGAKGYAFTATSGTNHTGNDFGNFEKITKSGVKLEDMDGDGNITEDSGNPLENWNIRLYGDNGSVPGALDATDTLLSTVATNASGEYSFPSLGPGSYIACEELKTGWQQTYPISGSEVASCTAVTGLGAKGYKFTAQSGTNETGNDFGNFEKITKSGVKLEDMDGDGNITEDSGNPLQNWNIRLYRDNGSVPGALDATDTLLSTVATNASGEYSFPSLGPGSYIACEELKAGWQQTYPTSGADCTAVATLGAKGYAFTATSGTDETGNDFGNFEKITKSGVKYNDVNGDGDLTDGIPLSGWDIKLYRDNGSVPGALDATDTLLSTVATNASGEYSFPNLGPGSYIACEVLKAGWQQTYPTSGADCTAVAGLGAKGYAFTAQSGTDETGNDFGNAQLFRLIIFTCSEATGELVKSEVTLSGKPTTFTWENVPAPLAGAGITESQLCSVADGARYNNLPADTYTPSVELPDVP